MSKKIPHVDLAGIKKRLPYLRLPFSKLRTALGKTDTGKSLLAEVERRIDELREKGQLLASDAKDIAWREAQVQSWIKGAECWPSSHDTEALVQEIRIGAVNPIRPIEEDIAEYAPVLEELLAAKAKPSEPKEAAKPSSLAKELTKGAIDSADEISRQLKEGEGRQATILQVYEWVADHLNNVNAMPLDAPSNAAFSRLLAARDDSRSFFIDYRQVMKDAQDGGQETLDDPRYVELEKVLGRFEAYHRFEEEMDIIRAMVPIAEQLVGGKTLRPTKEIKELFTRVLDIAREPEAV